MSCVDRNTTVLNSIVDAIGGTPCIQLNKVPQMHGLKCRVVAKCEFLNPGGSMKDRIGARMISEAEKAGRVKEGSTLIEATSGNTGVGLAMVSAARGYRMVITMPVKMSQEKQVVLETLGAEVIRTPMCPHDHPDSLISLAKRLEAEKGYVRLDQYANPANPDAHYYGTGDEIVNQCGPDIAMVVVGAGTGGTITGIARRLKERCPGVIVVGVDPHGSILADPTQPCEDVAYQVEGIGYDFVPDVCDRSVVDRWVKSGDRESFELARELHRYEGMLVGGSSGSAMYGVLEAAKDLRPDQTCVVVFPDNIRNYLSKFPDKAWRVQYGLEEGPVTRPTYDMLRKRCEELEAQLAAAEQKAQQ